MKAIIVYYSFSGNNELLAKELQTKLGCDMMQVHELNKRSGVTIFLDILFSRTPRVIKSKVLLFHYDTVILLAPIWAGRIANPMKAFIGLEKDNFKKYIFITLCGGGGNKKISSELRQCVGNDPAAILELKVSDLLKAKNKRLFTSTYKVKEQDLLFFNDAVEQFLQLEVNADMIHDE